MSTRPEPAYIEIVEECSTREHYDAVARTGYVKPNVVRINGIPLAVPRDEAVYVHDLVINSPDTDQLAKVTLTLFARRIEIGPTLAPEAEAAWIAEQLAPPTEPESES